MEVIKKREGYGGNGDTLSIGTYVWEGGCRWGRCNVAPSQQCCKLNRGLQISWSLDHALRSWRPNPRS